MKITQLPRIGIMVMLMLSISFGVVSCGNDDDPAPTNNTDPDPDPNPDPVVKQKLTIHVSQGGDPIFGKDVKLAKSYTDLDQGILIGTKTTNTNGEATFTELAPGQYAFEVQIAGGPLGTKRNTATIEEGFDADGYLNF